MVANTNCKINQTFHKKWKNTCLPPKDSPRNQNIMKNRLLEIIFLPISKSYLIHQSNKNTKNDHIMTTEGKPIRHFGKNKFTADNIDTGSPSEHSR